VTEFKKILAASYDKARHTFENNSSVIIPPCIIAIFASDNLKTSSVLQMGWNMVVKLHNENVIDQSVLVVLLHGRAVSSMFRYSAQMSFYRRSKFMYEVDTIAPNTLKVGYAILTKHYNEEIDIIQNGARNSINIRSGFPGMLTHILPSEGFVNSNPPENIQQREVEPADRHPNFIGAGAYGGVYKTTYFSTPVAVKWFDRADPNSPQEFKNVTSMLKELSYNWNLRHPNIANVLGGVILGATQRDRKTVGMCMELCDGDITALFKGRNRRLRDTNLTRFQENKKFAIDVLHQIAQGLHFMHTQGIAHSDLKPGNVLYSKTDEGRVVAKIADLGMAQAHANMPGYVGYEHTPQEYYCVPYEVIRRPADGFVDTKVDVYSFGLIALSIVQDSERWRHMVLERFAQEDLPIPTGSEKAREWRKFDPVWLVENGWNLPRLMMPLFEGCLADDPRERFDMLQVLRGLDRLKIVSEYQLAASFSVKPQFNKHHRHHH
jgi:hypothetical protein